jgi:hypothetical protein
VCRSQAAGGKTASKRIKSFCFFFQKEALSFLKKRNKKLSSFGVTATPDHPGG